MIHLQLVINKSMHRLLSTLKKVSKLYVPNASLLLVKDPAALKSNLVFYDVEKC